MKCPLCKESSNELFHQFKNKDYYRCNICDLTFLPKDFHRSDFDEKDIYSRHENSPEDIRYRKFLSRLFTPLKKRLKAKSTGLDFGCGPGPTLSIMLEEVGHKMSIFDKFFAFDESVFNHKYDFITATEVFEHLRDPSFEITRIMSCLKPKGFLGVMTKLAHETEDFSTWHYKNDPTHIIFFSRQTFHWISQRFQVDYEVLREDVIIMRRK